MVIHTLKHLMLIF